MPENRKDPTLISRLEHMEKGLSENGMRYEAEVVHNAIATLNAINKTIFHVGAPFGSPRYFKIRGLATGDLDELRTFEEEQDAEEIHS